MTAREYKVYGLEDKRVLITGGSSGIGKQCALDFLSCGAMVTISGSNQQKLDDAKSELSQVGATYALCCDLSNLAEVPGLVDRAVDAMGGIDILVCNAGINMDQLAIRMKLEDWQTVISVNLTATFLLNQRACQVFMRQKHGNIVNISSVVASTGNVGQANYCASKGGLEAMTSALALEFASRGIRANCVAPGFIDTEMTRRMTPEAKAAAVSTIPMRRIGLPRDVSWVVLFMCSDMASFMTGQVLHVNGGAHF